MAQRSVKKLLVTSPMAVVALGIGFMAQGLGSAPPTHDRRVLDSLIAAPAAPRPEAQAQRSSDLQGLQARRALRRTGQGVDLAEPEAGAPVDLEIRVALLTRPSLPDLSATGPWWLRNRGGALLARGGPGQPVGIGLDRSGEAELWLETGSSDRVLVQGRTYEGRIRLLRQDNGWLAVNHLSLERYIAAVVGSEMPSGWEMEALRAQAVAARSYALAHMARPANTHWHLGDTTRWQAYRGSEAVNTRTRQAAASTRGIILSYQGGIVESLYAANRQISLEAHGHLGASMSQHGAQELARSGRRYTQILASYYPGASLARLRRGAS
ncbi:MAG: SpoIID/LytB domain-containing protein [Cyanobacteriota bacterium]|nr:SpoIID/LytB domain-containing protein [Cyanobacteriota bacterium]